MGKTLLSKQDGRFLGDVGEQTTFIVNNQYLHVGDVVQLKSENEYFVVRDMNGYEVSGLYGLTRDNSWVIDFQPKIIKKFDNVVHGEYYNGVIMVDDIKSKGNSDYSDKITIKELDEEYCEICNRGSVFHIQSKDIGTNYYNIDLILCPDCLVNLGKKIIDALR